MPAPQPPVSRIAADVLTGFYKRKRLTQEEVSERAQMPLPTLQKKLKGKSPITATDLVVLSQAIGVDPVDVMAEIMKDSAEADRLASEGIASLDDHRKKRTPAEMTEEEMEGESNAASTDPEIGHDEPEDI